MNIITYPADEWFKIAETMHLEVFGEFRPKELNRIDFALVAWQDDVPLGYVTCVESDSESVYIGYGGAFGNAKKSIYTFMAYKMILDRLSKAYLRATTLIENTNTAMLKMAMGAGFRVTGIKNFKNIILLENSIDWELKNGI